MIVSACSMTAPCVFIFSYCYSYHSLPCACSPSSTSPAKGSPARCVPAGSMRCIPPVPLCHHWSLSAYLPVPARALLFIHMEFRGHSGSAESADEQQGILHRYRLIRKGMPDEGLRHFTCYLFLQGQLLSQFFLSAA